MNGKVVLVPGGTGGIGIALCTLLASQGAIVVATGRQRSRVQLLASDLRMVNPLCTVIEVSLDSFKEWEDLVRGVFARFQRIDVLVNCIGLVAPGALEELDTTEIDAIIRTNLISPIYAVKSVLPYMRSQGRGHIVNIGSLGGIIPMPFGAVYGASKSALRSICFAVREECRLSGVEVSIVSPGSVRTSMLTRESRDSRSTIPFVNTPLHTDYVARKICQLLQKPKAELVLPPMIGLPAKSVSHLPGLFSTLYPLLNFLGAVGQRKYRVRETMAEAT